MTHGIATARHWGQTALLPSLPAGKKQRVEGECLNGRLGGPLMLQPWIQAGNQGQYKGH